MDITHSATKPWRLTSLVRFNLALLSRCRSAFRAWRERERVLAILYSLSDWELRDIGITPGEIDYIASSRFHWLWKRSPTGPHD